MCVQASSDGELDLLFYLYSDYSNIQRSSDGYFINYDRMEILKISDIRITKLICQKAYYFILHYIDFKFPKYPIFIQFSIRSEESNNNIDITSSLLKSKSFTIFCPPYEQRNFYYTYNETKYVLIHYIEYARFQITENGKNVIYDKEELRLSQLFEFKKDKKYNIYYKTVNPNANKNPILFQIFNESKFFKYDFINGPMILGGFSFIYYLEIDISRYILGDNILFMFYGKRKEYFIKYQFKK